MPDDNSQVPSIPAAPSRLADELGATGLPPSLQILLDEGLYNRMKQLSMLMARAEGFTPRHLLGKGEACFAIINTALDWKLNPHFVARHTYQTPSGSIGFDGALVQSVLERSGRFIGSPEIEYHGDWQQLVGKFEIKEKAVRPTWTAANALGLGIIIRWQVRGEHKQRVWPGENTPFWLTQCYPLNSPLWATDPKTQIAYLGIRRFANLAAPGILGAASFDADEMLDASERARDVTPTQRPRPEDYAEPAPSEPDEAAAAEGHEDGGFEIVDGDGVAHQFVDHDEAIDFVLSEIDAAARLSKARLEGFWESNIGTITEIAGAIDGSEYNVGQMVPEPLQNAYRDALASFDKPTTREAVPAQSPPPAEAAPTNAGEQTPPAGPTPQSTQAVDASARRQPAPQPAQQRRTTERTAQTNSSQVAPQPPPKASTPAEQSEKSLAVPLVQRGRGATDWRATAERMVALIKSCTNGDDVSPLPKGKFRQANRQTMDTMRTADHDAWVTVEYALGQQMRQLQMGKK